MSSSSCSSRHRQSSNKVRRVICDCGNKCPLRTANTPWNRGKKFYSCPNWPQENHCQFFVWAEESDAVEHCVSKEEEGTLVQILLENRELRIRNSELLLKNREMQSYKIGLILSWIAIVVCLLICLAYVCQ